QRSVVAEIAERVAVKCAQRMRGVEQRVGMPARGQEVALWRRAHEQYMDARERLAIFREREHDLPIAVAHRRIALTPRLAQVRPVGRWRAKEGKIRERNRLLADRRERAIHFRPATAQQLELGQRDTERAA